MKLLKSLFLVAACLLPGSVKPVSFKVVRHFAANVLSYAVISHLVTEGIAGCVDNLTIPKNTERNSGVKARLLSRGTAKTTGIKVSLALAICLIHRLCTSCAVTLRDYNFRFTPSAIAGLVNYFVTPARFRFLIVEDV